MFDNMDYMSSNNYSEWQRPSINSTSTRIVHEMYSIDGRKSSKSKTSETNFTSLDKCIDKAREPEMFSIASLIRGHPKSKSKRQKTSDYKPIVFVRFNTSLGKPKPVTIKALLDSGGSGTLVTEKYAKKLRQKKSASATVWTTPAGNMSTTSKVKAQFSIPELHDNRLIEWDVHVTKDLGAYDMIIGRDILNDLGIDILFSTQTVDWENHDIPFKNVDDDPETAYHIQDTEAVEDSADRLRSILDAKYEAADLAEVVKEQSHLTDDEQQQLLTLLREHETLFDGTLGHWNDAPHEIELKKDVKPYHARAYPIPKVHTDALKLEVARLCEIGVLKKVNRSEWAAPTFIIPKKDKSVRFISDFRELNKRIKRQPYPIPKIQDMLLKLEGFRYATSLDLNMGYYHIELSPDAKKLCTIVLPFGKFEYQ